MHPDKNGSPLAEGAFTRLRQAHQILADPSAKQKYDAQRRAGGGWLGLIQRGQPIRKRRRILVVRHGSRPNGELDPSLDVLGKWQAEQVAAYLFQEMAGPDDTAPITALFSSPFRRTLQTAAPVAKVLNLKICVEWGFCDLLAHNWLYTIDPLPVLHARKHKSLPGSSRFDPEYKTAAMPEYPDLEGKLEQGNAWQRHRALKRHQVAVEAALAAATGGSVVIVGHGATHDFVADVLCPAQHLEEHHSGGFCVPLCSVTEIVEESDGWNLAAFGHTRWTEEDISPRARQRARIAAQSTFYKRLMPKKRRSSVASVANVVVACAAAAASVGVIWFLHYQRRRLK